MTEEFQDDIPANSFRRWWYVLHVKPRTEKKVASYLRILKCIHHLPLYVKVTRVQRRKVRRELPVFPGYVFARLPPDMRLAILRTNHIVRTIPIFNPRETVRQLRQVERVSKKTDKFTVSPDLFKVGDFVRVKYGPFCGMTGYVKRKGSQATICLNIDILGTSVETAVSPNDLEIVTAASEKSANNS